METKPICIRIPNDLIVMLDKVARKHEWSRNYVIGKLLKEKVYELIGDSD